MIKQLQLKRFQSHDDATLDFRPGVNMIVGESDKGKSAILRALRWVIFNRPSGFTFRSHWAGKGEASSVTVVMTNETVTRLRDEKRNVYEVGVFDNPLEAVRTDVPDEAKDALAMSDLNLQRQGDKPFLLDDPAPEVARVLNRVAGLDGIDITHTNVTGMIRDCQARSREVNGQLVMVDARLLAFKGLGELDGVLTTIEKETNAQRTEVQRLRDFDQLIQGLDQVELRLKKTEKLAGLRKQGAGVTSLLEESLEIEKRALLLTSYTREMEAIAFRLSALDVDRLDAVQHEFDNMDDGSELEARVAVLLGLGKQIAGLQDSIKEATTQEKVLQDELDTMDTCPECGADKKYWRK